MSLSEFDLQNIGKILAGHGTWFTAKLLRLIFDADPQNRAKLRHEFPEEVALVELWQHRPSEED